MKLTPLQRFWRMLKPDAREIQNVYIYAIFSGLIGLTLPLGIQAIVNFIQGGQVSTSWIVLVVIVVLGVAATGILQIYQLKITENLQQRIFARAAFEFAHRIPNIRLEALYRHYAPELMNRFFDIISIQKGLSKILIDFSAAVLQVIFGLILLSFYHPFFILFSLFMVLLVLAIFRFTARKGLATSVEESKFKYQVAHWLEELARTATTFKLAGRTNLPLTRMDDYVGDYLGARNEHFKILVQQYSWMVVFKVIVATGLLAIGGVLVLEQHMNIGQFIAAEIIILLVMSSVEKLILSLETIYDVLTALDKVGFVTDLELESLDGVEMSGDKSKGLALQMNDIGFNYPGQELPILKGLSLSIKPGEKVTIVGPNGSGKSTLLQVVAGLYTPQSGTITYDGLPSGNIESSSLRDYIGDCLSQEQLFEGTVLENISMNRKDVDMEDVRWAINSVGLGSFIENLPKGYDTMMDPTGRRLPRSIIQKLLIARSIADKPRLLLLEDA
ncbi:MAG: ATP-binding cassette domain-containing protein, partial [Flavobacteriales bacterium]|nr:ATP-binding cassette domain-containing protein [Flavobacteriales bacterium]